MKKILFLIGSLSGGGAEKVLVDVVNSLPREEFDITVQTVFDEGVHKSELNGHIKYKTIVGMKGKLFRKIKSYLILHYIPTQWLYKYFVEGDYDYEIAFLEGLPTKIIGCSKSDSVKYAWLHTNLINNFDSLSVFKNEKEYANCYKKFNKIICVSRSVKQGFENRFGECVPIEVIYNVLDEAKVIEKAAEPLCFEDKVINIVSVGRLVHQKGFDRLLRVAYLLKEKSLKFKIRIIGDGSEKEKLEKQLKDLQIQDCVEFLGFKNNPYPYIKNSDMMVCSSREEGFSTVVTEALILGTPVITTKCSGMEELFAGYNCGVIVENSEEALYKTLCYILKNPERIKDYKVEAQKIGRLFKMQSKIAELLKLFEDKKG